MLRPFFYLVFAFVFIKVFSQNLKYDIVRGETKIGYLDVTHRKDGDRETFTIKNFVELKVVFTFSVEYLLTEDFIGGVLHSGKGSNSMNGNLDKETTLTTTPKGYSLIMDGIAASAESKPITASVSQVYHHEPFHNKPIYSQYFGQYLYAEKIGDHQYRVVSPDGENIYTYEYGYCKEVKVSRDFATFYIRISPETSAMIRKPK